MLESGGDVQLGEADNGSVELRDDDTVAHDPKTLEPPLDRRSTRRIAELTQEGRDRARVAGFCIPDRRIHASRLWSGAGRSPDRDRHAVQGGRLGRLRALP